jgi:hypothetical protein
VGETGKNALRHPPNDPVLQLVSLNLTALSRDIEADWVVSVGPQELVDGHPMCGSNLQIECGSRPPAQRKHERADGNRRQDRRSRDHVVQGSSQILTAELNAHFFPGLPDGSPEEIGILGFPASPRQGHVARPGIARTLGSADQEDGIWVGSENNGYRCPHQRSVVVSRGLVSGQAFAEASKPPRQCECDWQPPPQQPPPGGGPRRL